VLHFHAKLQHNYIIEGKAISLSRPILKNKKASRKENKFSKFIKGNYVNGLIFLSDGYLKIKIKYFIILIKEKN